MWKGARWLLASALLASALLAGCNPAAAPSAAEDCANLADPACAPEAPPPACSDDEALALYRRRIEPLLKDERPSSCNRCHLTELDLALFTRSTPCNTMACLHEKELVDFETPERSLILRWIRRGDVGGGDAAGVAARQEYAAFAEWIEYSARCHAEVCAPEADPCGERPADAAVAPDAQVADAAAPADGAVPADAGAAADAHVADARAPDAALPDATVPDAGPPDPCGEPAMAALFEARVFRWRNRCNHCHSPHGITSGVGGAPLWMADGEDSAAALATMRLVIERGLVDVAAPERSLLVLKPLNRREDGIRHGGGTKFPNTEDEAYLDFRAWIDPYAACARPADAGAPDGGTP
jgi:hypothetical protein